MIGLLSVSVHTRSARMIAASLLLALVTVALVFAGDALAARPQDLVWYPCIVGGQPMYCADIP